MEDALELFYSIPKLGYTPDLMSYNNIIWSAGHLRRVDLAKKLFASLTSTVAKSSDSLVTHLRPNIYTYGALMHAFAKAKDYKQALACLGKMKSAGITPNHVVFTSAMEACAEAGMYKEALQVMDEIREVGLRPDLTMINTAVKACCLAGALEEAEALVGSAKVETSSPFFPFPLLSSPPTHTCLHTYTPV
jgi:pentatricopeptide repeat protein